MWRRVASCGLVHDDIRHLLVFILHIRLYHTLPLYVLLHTKGTVDTTEKYYDTSTMILDGIFLAGTTVPTGQNENSAEAADENIGEVLIAVRAGLRR